MIGLNRRPQWDGSDAVPCQGRGVEGTTIAMFITLPPESILFLSAALWSHETEDQRVRTGPCDHNDCNHTVSVSIKTNSIYNLYLHGHLLCAGMAGSINE